MSRAPKPHSHKILKPIFKNQGHCYISLRPSSRRAPCHALPTMGPDTWHTSRLIHTSGHCNTLMQEREQKSGEHRPTAGRCRSAHQEASRGYERPGDHIARRAGPAGVGVVRNVYTMGLLQRTGPARQPARLVALRDLVNKIGEKRGSAGYTARSAHRPPKRARRGEPTCACDLPGSISYTFIQS